ncbi:clarin-1 [Manacus vitellinus]|uniref:clarin-1 n=1 Tax=Manacus vitellinus TaxID=328815 RepID=UPI00115C94B6|nr:clarin-1 [Manacus vitellinus]
MSTEVQFLINESSKHKQYNMKASGRPFPASVDVPHLPTFLAGLQPRLQPATDPAPQNTFPPLSRAVLSAVFPDLLKIIPASIHVSVILFCTVLIIFALVGAGFFMFNAFGSPYETLHGPVGLYLWSFIACSCGCLIMILFSSEVKIHHLSEKIANFKEGTFTFKTHSEQFANSFWTILVCSLVHFLNALLIRFAGFEFPFSKSKDSGRITGAVDLMY